MIIDGWETTVYIVSFWGPSSYFQVLLLVVSLRESVRYIIFQSCATWTMKSSTDRSPCSLRPKRIWSRLLSWSTVDPRWSGFHSSCNLHGPRIQLASRVIYNSTCRGEKNPVTYSFWKMERFISEWTNHMNFHKSM